MASIVVAIAPIAVAAIRAVTRDWVPLVDDAIAAIRANDVFTHNVPLLGLRSSASLSAGVELNHPGPLLYDALAIPVRVLGPGAGTALGMAFLNSLAVVGIAVFAHRRGGPLLGAAAMTIVALLCWSAGSESLYAPWAPHAMLLPFLFFVVLVWSVSCGDLVALAWAVGVGSVVLQTHLSYTLLVPVLTAFGVVMLAFKLREDRRRDPARWAEVRARARNIGLVSVAVGVVCWVQPVIQQFTSEGRGNLTRLIESGGGDAHQAGFGFGARLLASVVSLPPWWFRPSFRHAFVRGDGWAAPSPAATAASLVALVLVLGVCWWIARRARDRVSMLSLVVAAVGLAVGLATARAFPLDYFDISTHSLRWMWPLSAFVTFAIAATMIRRVVSQPRLPSAVGVLLLLTLLVAALSLPTWGNNTGGSNASESALPGVHELTRQVSSSLDHKGPLLVDSLFRGRFAEPYGPSVLVALDERGVDFVVEDPMLLSHFGPERWFDGTNARNELLLRRGDEARTAPEGAHRIALSEGLSANARHELAELRRKIAGYVRDGKLQLDAAGDLALIAGELPNLAGELPGPIDPEVLFESREISRIGEAHWLDGDRTWQRRFERFAQLQGRFDARTVGLYLRPL